MYLFKGYIFLELTEPLQVGDFVVLDYKGLQIFEILKIGKQSRAYSIGGKWFASVFTDSRPKFILKNMFRVRKIDSLTPKLYEQEIFRFDRKQTIDSKMSIGIRDFLSSKNFNLSCLFENSEELDNRLENPFISEENRPFNVKSILLDIKWVQENLIAEKYCPINYT